MHSPSSMSTTKMPPSYGVSLGPASCEARHQPSQWRRPACTTVQSCPFRRGMPTCDGLPTVHKAREPLKIGSYDLDSHAGRLVALDLLQFLLQGSKEENALDTVAGWTRNHAWLGNTTPWRIQGVNCTQWCIQHVCQQSHKRCRSRRPAAHLYPAQIHLPLGPPMCYRIVSCRTVVGYLKVEAGAVLQDLQLNVHPEICWWSDQEVHKMKQRRSRQGRRSITSCIAYR
jgi:hypothetical protein